MTATLPSLLSDMELLVANMRFKNHEDIQEFHKPIEPYAFNQKVRIIISFWTTLLHTTIPSLIVFSRLYPKAVS